MSGRLAIGISAVALLVSASPAAAQSFGGVVLLVPSLAQPTAVRSYVAPVAVTGNVSLDFHGSQAAGCTAIGDCDISGTELFDPGDAGELLLVSGRTGRRYVLSGNLIFAGSRGASTFARTERRPAAGPGGVCADLSSLEDDSFLSGTRGAVSVRVGASSLSFLGSDIFATRCPGPLAADLISLLPSRPLHRSVLKRGGRMDLSTTRAFQAAGYEGTLRSTIVLKFGRADQQHISAPRHSPRGRRLREVAAVYRVTQVSGTVDVAFSGLEDPAQCLALDACGVSGQVHESPVARHGTLELTVLANAKRPARDARTLLGLARGGRAAGLKASGAGEWHSGTGSVQGSLSWNDGQGACTDKLPLRAGILTASARGRTLDLEYEPSETDDTLRMRCGGPLQTDLIPEDESLASGTVPLSALRRKTITLHLTRAPAVVPSGAFSGSVRSQITVKLTRERVFQHVFRLAL